MNSRIPGFHKHRLAERRALLSETVELSEETRSFLRNEIAVTDCELDRMSENVVGRASLPLSVGLNFRINGADVLIPMAVEEPSIVAAASHAAKLVRDAGGFEAAADPNVMTAQVQLDDVPRIHEARQRVLDRRNELIQRANEAIPRMVERGGGCVDVEPRVLDERTFVLHLHVDVGDAMGANLVDTVAEAVAPALQALIGGRMGLRILSNLPLRRKVRVTGRVPLRTLGPELVDGIARASRFAELDVFRAVTHNKGILNAVDAVAVAMGQDWRSIEAGAHAFASMNGAYRPLAVWRSVDDALVGTLEMPMAVGTVGGSTRAHAAVRAAFDIMKPGNAQDLGMAMGAAGLACNLAALRALTSEGIQKGHMRLHHRKIEGGEPKGDRA
ncbi:MAG: hydroxymethylglutaryl-CoA reductase, degradative [Myxococcota bacterium]